MGDDHPKGRPARAAKALRGLRVFLRAAGEPIRKVSLKNGGSHEHRVNGDGDRGRGALDADRKGTQGRAHAADSRGGRESRQRCRDDNELLRQLDEFEKAALASGEQQALEQVRASLAAKPDKMPVLLLYDGGWRVETVDGEARICK